MKKRLTFNKTYFLLALLILIIEILIAKYAHDPIIRPYLGDTLVVILIYCFVKAFLNTPVVPTALSVLAFSFLIETLQYFKIVNRLGLQDSKIAAIVIGTSFSWIDIIAYIAGIILILIAEYAFAKKKQNIVLNFSNTASSNYSQRLENEV